MVRRAILQIGTEKTGTTTLQRFFAVNRASLARAGYVYPRFCGEQNHTGLAAYALHPAKADAIREPFGVRTKEDVEPMRARMRAAARLELDAGCDAIFCSEHCHSRLSSTNEVAMLRDFLAPFFDEIKVCVYLRRQDHVAVSLYSTRLKSGDASASILPESGGREQYYNYDRFLALWEDAFGAQNMHVRLFDRAELAGGSVVSDFLNHWGIVSDTFVDVPDINASLQPIAQEFMRRANVQFKALGSRSPAFGRGPLAARLEAAYSGKGARPARAAAEAFYDRFRESNEAVRRRYFADRPGLFDEDFSSYPEIEDSRDFSLDDFAAVAVRMHLSVYEDVCRLEAEVAVREARLMWGRDERDGAMAALRRALAWRPNHGEAHRTMGEYHLRENRVEEAIAAARAAVDARPASPEYWHFLGMALRRADAFAEALAAQEKALALEPGHAGATRERDQLAGRLTDAAGLKSAQA